MDFQNLERTVELACPTCGGNQFCTQQSEHIDVEELSCVSCGRKMLKEELLHLNSENLASHVEEIGDLALKEIESELKEMLKRAFRGSSNLKIK